MKALFFDSRRRHAEVVDCDPDTLLALDDKFMKRQRFTLPQDELDRIHERRCAEAGCIVRPRPLNNPDL